MEDVAAEETLQKAKARGKARGRRVSQHDVVVQGAEGPVTVIDNSTNLAGDGNIVAGGGPAAFPVETGELMGAVTEAVDGIYRAMKMKLPLADLGRVSLERAMDIASACRDPEEYPHALEIMKLRLRRQLADEKAG